MAARGLDSPRLETNRNVHLYNDDGQIIGGKYNTI